MFVVRRERTIHGADRPAIPVLAHLSGTTRYHWLDCDHHSFAESKTAPIVEVGDVRFLVDSSSNPVTRELDYDSESATPYDARHNSANVTNPDSSLDNTNRCPECLFGT